MSCFAFSFLLGSHFTQCGPCGSNLSKMTSYSHPQNTPPIQNECDGHHCLAIVSPLPYFQWEFKLLKYSYLKSRSSVIFLSDTFSPLHMIPELLGIVSRKSPCETSRSRILGTQLQVLGSWFSERTQTRVKLKHSNPNWNLLPWDLLPFSLPVLSFS